MKILRPSFIVVPMCLVALTGCRMLTHITAPNLALATDGTTAYQVVQPTAPSPVDIYAIDTLTNYLQQITGAVFPVVTPGAMRRHRPAIFVGISPPVERRRGNDLLDAPAEQQHTACSRGRDIFLYGQGIHGNLYAVMDFLKHSLGWRWYSVFEEPVIPKHPTVTLVPFTRTRGFAFSSREVQPRYGYDFYVQNGINMGLERRFRKLGNAPPAYLVSYLPTENFVHSLFAYMPPDPRNSYADDFLWMTNRNYFATHPEFFSMNAAGKRVSTMQVCFSNPALRRELTRNVMRHIEVSGTNQYITIDAADHTGTFCHCPDCAKLEAKYQSPGGPMVDYILELCAIMKRIHPGMYVKMLAYRRTQTQKPPVLPRGGKLPGNLIVAFAPIEDCYFADWTYPDPAIQETYRDLVAWGQIVDHHLWVWIYPNPWGTGAVMPVGNIGRLITNTRLMYEAGATGVFTDHNGYVNRAGLSELQQYVLFALMENMDCDTDAVVTEFTDHQYGIAGPLARAYIAELEEGRRAMNALPARVTFSSSTFDERTFPYLTADNIYRWERLFDRMEQQVAFGPPEHLLNLRCLRRELDFAALWRWFDLVKTYPEYFTDHTPYAERIATANQAKAPAGMQLQPLGTDALKDFVTLIASGGEKPLPPQFADTDPARIKTYMPHRYAGTPRSVPDLDAAFGAAALVDQPEPPFTFGFFQWKSRHPRVTIPGPKLTLSATDITPDKYTLYSLGEIDLATNDSLIYMGRSWGTHLDIGSRLFLPGTDNRWDAYVSLKFLGDTYGGEGQTQVLCDRIILVKK